MPTTETPTPEQILEPRLLTERQARMAWSLLIEPGDADVHRFTTAAGGFAAGLQRLFDKTIPVGLEDDPLITAALGRWFPRLSSGAFLVAIRALPRYNMKVIIPGDEHWPNRIDQLDAHRPIVLYVRGDSSFLVDEKMIAMVGARAATGYGEHMAMELTSALVDKGVTIVSGAAYGIDGMAHRATLASSGRTIAVLAGGTDRFYPAGHDALLTRIAEAGAVVSELPPGSQPTKWRFLQRNRLIAALSSATVVVEAGWRSGSLNTAGHASALGVPLGAVPGPVTSAASAGCHRLIRDFNATCITNATEAYELAGFAEEEES